MHSPPGWQACVPQSMAVPSTATRAVLASGHPVCGRAEKRAKWVSGMWMCPGRPLPVFSLHPVSNAGQAGPLCPLPSWNKGHQQQLLGRFLVTILHYQAGNGVSQLSVLQKSYLTLLSGGSPWLAGQELTLMLRAHIHGHSWF